MQTGRKARFKEEHVGKRVGFLRPKGRKRMTETQRAGYYLETGTALIRCELCGVWGEPLLAQPKEVWMCNVHNIQLEFDMATRSYLVGKYNGRKPKMAVEEANGAGHSR